MNATKPAPKVNPPAPAVDQLVRDVLFAAGDQSTFADAVEQAIATMRIAVTGTVADEHVEAIASAARAVIGRFATMLANGGATSAAASYAANQVRPIFDALNVALSGPDSSDLAAKQADVRAIEREHAERLAELEQAVCRGDVEQVTAIRPDIEVRLPQRLGDAQLAVAEAQIAQARHHLPTAEATAARNEQTNQDGLARIAALQAELAEAHAAQQHLAVIAAIADTARTQLETTVNTALAERDQLAAQITADKATRIRRLAGLPDEPTADPADSGARKLDQMLTKPRVAQTGTEPGYYTVDGKKVADVDEVMRAQVAKQIAAGQECFTPVRVG